MKEKNTLSFFGLLLAALVICTALSAARSQKSQLKWSVNGIEVRSNGDSDSITIRIEYEFLNSQMTSKSAYVLQPRLSDGSHMILLRPVSIYGTSSDGIPVQVRSGNLPASGIMDEVRLTSDETGGKVVVENTVPGQEWMKKSRITILASEWYRKDICRTDRLVEVADVSYPDIIRFKCELSPLEPPEDAGKELEFRYPVHIDYGSDRSVLIPSAGGNQRELMLFGSQITTLLDHPEVTAGTFRIECWTSPSEGTKKNMDVTVNRISSLKQYLSSAGVRHIESAQMIPQGEDWEGMLGWLKRSSWWSMFSLDTLFRENVGHDRAMSFLRERYPVIYRDLENYCFPELDRTECFIRYTVRDFDSDTDLREAFNQDERLLSLHDMWVMSRRFPYDTDQWRRIFIASSERFPESSYASLNAASVFIRMGRYHEASALLRKCRRRDSLDEKAADHLNYLEGVWQMLAGDPRYGFRILSEFEGRNGIYSSAFRSAKKVIQSMDNVVQWDVSVNME